MYASMQAFRNGDKKSVGISVSSVNRWYSGNR